MTREHVPVAWRAAFAGLVALLALPVQPVEAQGFLQSLFGNDAPAPRRPADGYVRPRSAPGYSAFGGFFSPFQSQPHDDDTRAYDRGTYRTLCVRMCDGFYFPISYATGRANFTRDAEKCTAACGGDARLFYYPNPGGDIETMLDTAGRAYASYPTAFKYRKTLVKGCQCRPQPWTEVELARHRAYAAAQSPAGQATTGTATPVPENRDPVRVAGYQQADLAAPQPIDRSELEGPAPQVPPIAIDPARGPVGNNPQMATRSKPAPRRAQAGQWDWYAGVGGSRQARSSYSWSGAR